MLKVMTIESYSTTQTTSLVCWQLIVVLEKQPFLFFGHWKKQKKLQSPACESFFPLIIQEIVIQVDICGVDVFQVKVVQIQIIQGLQVQQNIRS